MNQSITFQQCAALYIERKSKRNQLKPKTISGYAYLLNRLNETFGSKLVAEITVADIELFIDGLYTEEQRSDPSAVAYELANVLSKAGLSRAALAKRCGLCVGTVEAAAKGKTVKLKSAEKIAMVLGQSVTDIFEVGVKKERLSDKIILEHFRLLRAILNFAIRQEWIQTNPCSRVETPGQQNKKINYYQPDLAWKILNALNSEDIKWKTFVHLLLVTGARRGEIAALDWSKIDFKYNIIEISQNLVYIPKEGLKLVSPKGNRPRYIKIPQETIKILLEYKAAYEAQKQKAGSRWHKAVKEQQRYFEKMCDNTEFLFVQRGTTGFPMHPDSANNFLIRFQERNGFPHLNPHAFRHSMASILIFEGQDIVSISHRLGHRHPSTTSDMYGQLILLADARNSACIADVLLRKPDSAELCKVN